MKSRRSSRITWCSWSYSYLFRLPVGISITTSIASSEARAHDSGGGVRLGRSIPHRAMGLTVVLVDCPHAPPAPPPAHVSRRRPTSAGRSHRPRTLHRRREAASPAAEQVAETGGVRAGARRGDRLGVVGEHDALPGSQAREDLGVGVAHHADLDHLAGELTAWRARARRCAMPSVCTAEVGTATTLETAPVEMVTLAAEPACRLPPSRAGPPRRGSCSPSCSTAPDRPGPRCPSRCPLTPSTSTDGGLADLDRGHLRAVERGLGLVGVRPDDGDDLGARIWR